MAATIAINVTFEEAGLAKISRSTEVLGDLGRAAKTTTSSQATLDRSNQQLAQSAIRAAVAQRNYQLALSLVNSQLRNATPGTVRYNQLVAQQAVVVRQADSANRGLRSTLGGVAGGLGEVAGGLGVAVTGYQALAFAADSFKKAANIEATQANFRIFIGDADKANQILAQGAAFADRYAFKQTEINQALLGSVDLFKATRRPAEEVLSVLTRLASRNLDEGISGASFAIGELLSGDTVSLTERFRVNREQAKALKAEIQSGVDPVLALDRALNQLNATNDILAQRTQGSQGAVNQLGAATEKLQVSFGNLLGAIGVPDLLNSIAEDFKFAAIGADFLRVKLDELFGGFGRTAEKAQLASTIQRELSTTVQLLNGGLANQAVQAGIAAQATDGQTAAIVKLNDATQKQIVDSADAELATVRLTQAKQTLTGIAEQVRLGTLDLADAQSFVQRAFGVSGDQAEILINTYLRLARAQAILNLPGAAVNQAGKGLGAAVKAAEAYAEQQERIRDAQFALLGPEQQLADLRKRLTTGGLSELERLQTVKQIRDLEGQIAAERARGAKSAATAANKAERAATKEAKAAERAAEELEKARDALRTDQEKLAARQAELSGTSDETRRLELQREILDLQNKIADAAEREAQAAVDAQLARLEDSKLRRQEIKDLEQAQRILRSQGASAEQRQAARDRIREIELERQKRGLEIAEKERQAGARAAAGAAAVLPPGMAATVGAIAGQQERRVAAGSTSAAGAAAGTMLQLVLSVDGQTIRESIVQAQGGSVFVDLTAALQQVISGNTLLQATGGK